MKPRLYKNLAEYGFRIKDPGTGEEKQKTDAWN